MTLLLYNLLWPIGLLFFLPGFLLKMLRRGGYRRNFGQRFGFYGVEVRERLRGKAPVWLHAVSVGEVLIALKLAAQLRTLRPDLHCALTTTTTTGYAFAEKSAPPWVTVLYSPLDFWPVMRRAFRLITPRAIVLVEAEVWPNLVSQASQHDIPVVLANARLSERSEKKFLRYRFLLAPIFRKLSLLCLTESADEPRWQRIGAQPERIRAVGSIKFDPVKTRAISAEPRRLLDKIGIEPTRPVLLGGSTHGGEEEILAETLRALLPEFPDLFLIVAPRHVERADEIESRLQNRRLVVMRRTKVGGKSPPDVLLIDTTGELADWYQIATAVFIGKSMTAHGGQNPVEAIAAGKPVIFGPHMENFARLSEQLLECGGAICARDVSELTASARVLLSDAARGKMMTAQATRVLAIHRGATARTAELMDALL